jgi:hypothetical protein
MKKDLTPNMVTVVKNCLNHILPKVLDNARMHLVDAKDDKIERMHVCGGHFSFATCASGGSSEEDIDPSVVVSVDIDLNTKQMQDRLVNEWYSKSFKSVVHVDDPICYCEPPVSNSGEEHPSHCDFCKCRIVYVFTLFIKD